jgi:hypothetical protein
VVPYAQNGLYLKDKNFPWTAQLNVAVRDQSLAASAAHMLPRGAATAILQVAEVRFFFLLIFRDLRGIIRGDLGKILNSVMCTRTAHKRTHTCMHAGIRRLYAI